MWSLHIMQPKTNAYVKIYNGHIEDNDLLEKYNNVWDKVSPDIKR